jgi:NAD dependent epimerase/dehydratase
MTASFWQGRRVLVTGAGGFIGSHLIEKLVMQGAQVRAFVRYNSRGDLGLLNQLSSQTLGAVNIISGDLRDLCAVQNATQGMSHVLHLGALIAIPYSYLHPAEVVETNVIGTLNVLLASRLNGVERIVHTSTSEVYGTALQVPINEDHPLQGQSPYSASKIGADKLAESFFCSYNLPVVTIRPFNTYGPRQSARAVIPTIITQVLSGSRLRLGNLDTRRDFTFVNDTVDGFLKCAEESGIEGRTFNLGTGSEVSVRELVDEIVRISGKDVELITDQERLRPERSEVLRLLSDNSRARQELGWEPKIILKDGLAQTYQWISDHIELYQVGKYQR